MAADYRSLEGKPTNSTNSTKSSYASITQSPPSKEQAIVIEAIDQIPLKEYVLAVGKLTEPSNIRYVSRISNARICIYLASKKVAEEIVTKYPKVKVGNMLLELRPLITKNVRVVLSNVSPVIPDYVIEEHLSHIGITPVSRINPIRAGISEPGFTHILSFRRQMFIQPTDLDKLPSTGSLQIMFEDTNYWVYLTTDTTITCFICKQEGHLAKQCKNVQTNNETAKPLNNVNTQSKMEETSTPDKTEFPELRGKINTQLNNESEPVKTSPKNQECDLKPTVPVQESSTKLKRAYPTSNTSISNPSIALPTSQALHLIHLASRPWV